MTKPIQAINRYKADLRELAFLLFEQFRIGEDLLGKAPYDAWGEDEVRSSLTEAYRFVKEIVGPLNSIGDAGCKLEGGKVITPTGFKDAWKKLYEAGWKAIGVSTEHGGAGAPRCVQALIEEMLSGSNTAFNMYPGLSAGAAEVIHSSGTQRQKEI